MGMIASKEDAIDNNYSPWGYEFAKKLGLNVLSFTSFFESKWYRCEKFHDWLGKSSKLLSIFPERIGYGGSMGGYAASAFSNPLGIDRLLLLNPISSLKRELVPWETRSFENAAKLQDWSGRFADGAETKSDGWVVYDPIFNLDSYHAKRFKNLKKIVFPGVGHQIPKHLNYLELLKPLIQSFVTNKFDSNDFYKRLRNRRNYLNYYSWLESNQNRHKTHRRNIVVQQHKRAAMEKAAQVDGHGLNLIEQILSVALEIEEHDLPTYEKLDKLVDRIRCFGVSTLTKEDVEFFKFKAIEFERKNIHISLCLMRVANNLRPNGPFIIRKVREYEFKLQQHLKMFV